MEEDDDDGNEELERELKRELERMALEQPWLWQRMQDLLQREDERLQQEEQQEEEHCCWDEVGYFERLAEEEDGDARARRSDRHVSCYSSVAPVIGYDASSITSPALDLEDHPLAHVSRSEWDVFDWLEAAPQLSGAECDPRRAFEEDDFEEPDGAPPTAEEEAAAAAAAEEQRVHDEEEEAREPRPGQILFDAVEARMLDSASSRSGRRVQRGTAEAEEACREAGLHEYHYGDKDPNGEPGWFRPGDQLEWSFMGKTFIAAIVEDGNVKWSENGYIRFAHTAAGHGVANWRGRQHGHASQPRVRRGAREGVRRGERRRERRWIRKECGAAVCREVRERRRCCAHGRGAVALLPVRRHATGDHVRASRPAR